MARLTRLDRPANSESVLRRSQLYYPLPPSCCKESDLCVFGLKPYFGLRRSSMCQKRAGERARSITAGDPSRSREDGVHSSGGWRPPRVAVATAFLLTNTESGLPRGSRSPSPCSGVACYALLARVENPRGKLLLPKAVFLELGGPVAYALRVALRAIRKGVARSGPAGTGTRPSSPRNSL